MEEGEGEVAKEEAGQVWVPVQPLDTLPGQVATSPKAGDQVHKPSHVSPPF